MHKIITVIRERFSNLLTNKKAILAFQKVKLKQKSTS